MPSFELVVRFKHWQYFLNVTPGETLTEIKNQIEFKCGINLNNEEYVLEIYDVHFDEYTFLNERYLAELHKSLPMTPIQRLEARIEPLHRKDDLSPVSVERLGYAIVWLDENIGRPDAYSSLKRVFGSTVDAHGASCLNTDERRDIDNLIRLEGEPLHTAMHLFDKSDDCLTFVRNNAASTAIFLVTSVSLGRDILPLVVKQVQAIYVLCTRIESAIEWALDYIEYHIMVFNFDTDLLIRLTRDIADYCVEKGKERMISSHLEQALDFLSNAQKLILRADMIDKGSINKRRLDDIYQLLQLLKDVQKNSSQCQEV